MSIDNREAFLSAFRFNSSLRGYAGVERERFLVDKESGLFVPRSPEFLDRMSSAWTHEFSACMVEDRTPPLLSDVDIRSALVSNDEEGRARATALGLRLIACEVAPANIPTDVYPSEPRYQRIRAASSTAQLAVGHRIAGTHVHRGVADWDEALRVYNALTRRWRQLAAMGDSSDGERLRMFGIVVPDAEPMEFGSVEALVSHAAGKGFLTNPRNGWHGWVRISIHGTVEVRTFGSTENVEKVMSWVAAVRAIADAA